LNLYLNLYLNFKKVTLDNLLTNTQKQMYHCCKCFDDCCKGICKACENCAQGCNKVFSRPFALCVFITFFILFCPAFAGFYYAAMAEGSDCDMAPL